MNSMSAKNISHNNKLKSSLCIEKKEMRTPNSKLSTSKSGKFGLLELCKLSGRSTRAGSTAPSTGPESFRGLEDEKKQNNEKVFVYTSPASVTMNKYRSTKNPKFINAPAPTPTKKSSFFRMTYPNVTSTDQRLTEDSESVVEFDAFNE